MKFDKTCGVREMNILLHNAMIRGDLSNLRLTIKTFLSLHSWWCRSAWRRIAQAGRYRLVNRQIRHIGEQVVPSRKRWWRKSCRIYRNIVLRPACEPEAANHILVQKGRVLWASGTGIHIRWLWEDTGSCGTCSYTCTSSALSVWITYRAWVVAL